MQRCRYPMHFSINEWSFHCFWRKKKKIFRICRRFSQELFRCHTWVDVQLFDVHMDHILCLLNNHLWFLSPLTRMKIVQLFRNSFPSNCYKKKKYFPEFRKKVKFIEKKSQTFCHHHWWNRYLYMFRWSTCRKIVRWFNFEFNRKCISIRTERCINACIVCQLLMENVKEMNCLDVHLIEDLSSFSKIVFNGAHHLINWLLKSH